VLNATCLLPLAAHFSCGALPSVCLHAQDPNSLSLTLPEGVVITSRVLRRSEEQVADDRFETSEFLQQVFDDGSIGEEWSCSCALRLRSWSAGSCFMLRIGYTNWLHRKSWSAR
jgi:hypothetical protein